MSGLLPDADKLFGAQGTFRSILLISLVGARLVGAARYPRDAGGRVRTAAKYAPLVAALLASHLLLDLLGGGPIFLLAPGLGPDSG